MIGVSSLNDDNGRPVAQALDAADTFITHAIDALDRKPARVTLPKSVQSLAQAYTIMVAEAKLYGRYGGEIATVLRTLGRHINRCHKLLGENGWNRGEVERCCQDAIDAAIDAHSALWSVLKTVETHSTTSRR